MNYCTEQAFGLCLGTLSYSFLSLGQLPTFSPLHFQCYKMSLKVSLMWSFSLTSLLLGHFMLFITVTFLMRVDICLPWVPLAVHLNSLKQQYRHCIVSHVFWLHWHHFKFHFEHYPFPFLCWAFIFVAQFSLSLTCKISCGFVTERQRGNSFIHFAVCKWIEWQMFSGQSPPTLKEVT